MKELIVAAALASGIASIPLPTPPEPRAFQTVLDGSWDQGSDFASLCGADRAQHTMQFSDDGKNLVVKFDKPHKIYDGSTVTSVTYQVLATSDVSLTLALEGDSRHDTQGSPIVWELVVVGSGLFRWRATSYPVGTYNDVLGRRCK